MYKGHIFLDGRFRHLRRVVPCLVAVLALASCQEAVPPPAVSFVTEKPAISIPTLTEGVAMASVRLPAAIGGSGALTYDLKPEVPGLTFTAATRDLSGTPTAAGSYSMTYTATDTEEEDTASLRFTITVQAAPPPLTVDPTPTAAAVANGTYLAAVLGGDANDELTLAGAAALTEVLTDDQVAALLAADWWKTPAELAAASPAAYAALLAALAPMYDMHLDPTMHTVTLRENLMQQPRDWRFIPPIDYATLAVGAAPIGALVGQAAVEQTESCYLSVDEATALLGGSSDPAAAQRVAACVTFSGSSLSTMQAVEVARTCAGGGCAGEAGLPVLAAIGATVLSGMIDSLGTQLTDMIIGEWLLGRYVGGWWEDDDDDGIGELRAYTLMHILDDSAGFTYWEDGVLEVDVDHGPWMHRRTSRGGEFVSVDGLLHYRFIPEHLNTLAGGTPDHDSWMTPIDRTVVGTWSGMADDHTYTLAIDERGAVVLTVSGAEQHGWILHDVHIEEEDDGNNTPVLDARGFPVPNGCGDLLMLFPDADEMQAWRYCLDDEDESMMYAEPPPHDPDEANLNLVLIRQ